MIGRRAAPPAAPAWRDRPMVLADVERVAAVEVTAYSHPWTRGNFIDSLVAGHPAGLRETADGELIGYWVVLGGVEELHLLNITVAPSHRRQGQGRALLAQVLALADERGDATVWLEVREHNPAAHALYRAAGFEAVGRRKGYYPGVKGREDAVVMRLDRSASAGGFGRTAAPATTAHGVGSCAAAGMPSVRCGTASPGAACDALD